MNTCNKIIFVCMGNTCRSPMAATIMQNRLSKYDVIVESRGMVVLFEEPYNPKAVAVAACQVIMQYRLPIMILEKIRLFWL